MKVRRRKPRRPNRTPGHALDVVVAAVRQLVDGFRHALTGGASTRRRAVRRATAPPQKCPRCHQPVSHSPDWRDHLH
jgi:hypothetical protein